MRSQRSLVTKQQITSYGSTILNPTRQQRIRICDGFLLLNIRLTSDIVRINDNIRSGVYCFNVDNDLVSYRSWRTLTDLTVVYYEERLVELFIFN